MEMIESKRSKEEKKYDKSRYNRLLLLLLSTVCQANQQVGNE